MEDVMRIWICPAALVLAVSGQRQRW
jgi:hypothetical protein